MKTLVKYKTRSHITKGIKTNERILYENINDRVIKIYFENLYHADTEPTIIQNNGKFNFEWNIDRALERLTKSKATGVDGIPSKLFKIEKDNPLIKKIRNWFGNWIRKGRTPKYLTSWKLILLSKDNTETSTIEDTRTITILPTVTKVFESSILHNFETIVESRKLNKSQRGFRKKMSTLDNIRDVLKKKRIEEL